MVPTAPLVAQHGARSIGRPPSANRFMAPAWRWLRTDGAANCVWQTTRSPGLALSVGLPDGVEALHPKVTATALIGDEPLQLIGFVVQLVWSGYR